MHYPTQTSKEATPSSDREAPSIVAAYYAQDGIKGSNKRYKQCPLGTVTMTSHGKDRGKQVGSFGVGQVLTAVHGNRHLVRTPIDHFKRLLEEACPNHAYPIKHNLKDCDMLQSFMTSGSLTWGAIP
jgi:hypothetical protein